MPALRAVCYAIYHSANSYLGLRIAEQELAGLPVTVERRPLCIPKDRGVKVADLVGGAEPPGRGDYNREDCRRWAAHYGIPWSPLPPEEFEARARRWAASPWAREELPARAYYAALGTGREAALDRALYDAAWIDGLDVNEELTVRVAAARAGLDPDALLADARGPLAGARLAEAVATFDRDRCPGVPTWVLNGERYWGKDRASWLADRVRALAGQA
jgi:2-hydroxychromene-2-carboxylate isomerase